MAASLSWSLSKPNIRELPARPATRRNLYFAFTFALAATRPLGRSALRCPGRPRTTTALSLGGAMFTAHCLVVADGTGCRRAPYAASPSLACCAAAEQVTRDAAPNSRPRHCRPSLSGASPKPSELPAVLVLVRAQSAARCVHCSVCSGARVAVQCMQRRRRHSPSFSLCGCAAAAAVQLITSELKSRQRTFSLLSPLAAHWSAEARRRMAVKRACRPSGRAN